MLTLSLNSEAHLCAFRLFAGAIRTRTPLGGKVYRISRDLLKRVTSHRIMKYSLHFLRILNSAYRVYGGCRVECGSVAEVEKRWHFKTHQRLVIVSQQINYVS